MLDFAEDTVRETIELEDLTSLETGSGSRSGTDVQDLELPDPVSSVSFRTEGCWWAAEATASSKEVRASSMGVEISTPHIDDVSPEGEDAPTASGAASEEARGPATAGTPPCREGGDDRDEGSSGVGEVGVLD